MHTAQALNNVPARYDQARLRRPTTPLTGRGCPIGLGVNLDVTTPVPATEMIINGGGDRTSGIIAIPPTDLLCPLRRFAVDSRPSTPEGSQPAFAWGDVATPIQPVTGWPSLPPSSFTRSLVGSPYGPPTLAGRLRAYHVASREPSWVRPRLYAGGPSSAPGECKAPGPGHVPFWSKPISTFGLFFVTTLTAVHLGWPYHAPLVPDRRSAGSRDLGSRSGRHPEDEDTLSRGLRTPLLPGTHASVGDCWQNSRCYHLLLKSNTVPATPSCRTYTAKPRVALRTLGTLCNASER
jgi:hypothetical protein